MIRIIDTKEKEDFVYNIWLTPIFQYGKLQGMGLSRRQLGIEIKLDLVQELFETARGEV